MKKEEIFNKFLSAIPQLTAFYDHEKEILRNEEMTVYLFFAYVIEPLFDHAVYNNDKKILRQLFAEIEYYIVNNPNDCIDVINSSLFEDFEDVFLSSKVDCYMKVETKKLLGKYCEYIRNKK